MRRLLPALLLLGLLSLPRAASAVTLRLELGGNYWLVKQALFDGNLGIEVTVVPGVSVGGRVGMLLTTDNVRVGFPIDLLVRLTMIPSLYIEGLAGPWLILNAGDSTLRTHAAISVGLEAGPFSVGPEVGWLDPEAIIGAKFAIRL